METVIRRFVKEYRESDLGIAAYLVVKGFPILGLERVNGRRYAFRFEDENGQTACAAVAYLRDDCVSARQLVGAMKDLKTMLYSKHEYGDGDDYGKRNRY
jgi:hypothetical protein